jgi:hypothetical protein
LLVGEYGAEQLRGLVGDCASRAEANPAGELVQRFLPLLTGLAGAQVLGELRGERGLLLAVERG